MKIVVGIYESKEFEVVNPIWEEVVEADKNGEYKSKAHIFEKAVKEVEKMMDLPFGDQELPNGKGRFICGVYLEDGTAILEY